MDFGDVIRVINDLFPYIVMIGGVVWGWIQRKYKLPKIVVDALNAMKKVGITEETLRDMFLRIGTFVEATDAERRETARRELQRLAKANGITLSDSTANLIIEWVYKKAKEK